MLIAFHRSGHFAGTGDGKALEAVGGMVVFFNSGTIVGTRLLDDSTGHACAPVLDRTRVNG